LADLIVLVLAVGVSAGVARQARDAWGNCLIPTGVSPSGSATGPWRGVQVPLERTAGVVFEVAAIFLILSLARTLIGLVRARRGWQIAGASNFLWSITWRAGAIVMLLAFVADQADVLRIDYARQFEIRVSRPGWEQIYAVRQNLLPVYGALAIVGLGLGMGAGALFEDPRPASHRPYWLFVPLAAVVAVLLSAKMKYAYPLIVYVALQALEAVSIAMHDVPHDGPGLPARLLSSGWDASLALLACTALAVVVAHDFDRAGRRLPWATKPSGRLGRVVLSLIVLYAGVHVAAITVPKIHPCLAQGFAQILTPDVLSATVGGFGLFALGLAARAVTPRQATGRPAWVRWLSTFIRNGLLLVCWLSAVKELPLSSQLPPAIPTWIGRMIDMIGRAHVWVWSFLPYQVAMILNYCMDSVRLPWILTAIFVSVVVFELTIRKPAMHAAPFDAVFNSARWATEVAWLTVALALVCVVALPILIVLGQLIVHVQLNLEDWVKLGWPR
jgi:hypothetical protein